MYAKCPRYLGLSCHAEYIFWKIKHIFISIISQHWNGAGYGNLMEFSALLARPPTPDQSVYHAGTQVWKTPPSRGFWTKKTPLFQPKSLILRPNKTPLFKQNAIFFVLYAIPYPFCESDNIRNCIKLKTCFYLRRIFHYFSIMVKAQIHLCITIQTCRINKW